MHLLAVADPKQNEVHAYMHARNLDTQFDILKNCDVYTINMLYGPTSIIKTFKRLFALQGPQFTLCTIQGMLCYPTHYS